MSPLFYATGDGKVTKTKPKPVNLKKRLLKTILDLGGEYQINNDTVYATLPDGASWEFTVPKKSGQYEPEDK